MAVKRVSKTLRFTVLAVLIGIAALVVVWGIMFYGYYSLPTVDFYGQVLNDSGKPVEGVEVLLRVWHKKDVPANETLINAATKLLRLHTDAAGKFAVKGEKGLSLSILQMQKPGYEPVIDLSWGPAAPDWLSNDNRYYFYDRNAFPGYPVYHPDESLPAIFPMFPPNSRATGMPSRGGMDYYPDGKIVQNKPVQLVIPSTGLGAPKDSLEQTDRLKAFVAKARAGQQKPL